MWVHGIIAKKSIHRDYNPPETTAEVMAALPIPGPGHCPVQ